MATITATSHQSSSSLKIDVSDNQSSAIISTPDVGSKDNTKIIRHALPTEIYGKIIAPYLDRSDKWTMARVSKSIRADILYEVLPDIANDINVFIRHIIRSINSIKYEEILTVFNCIINDKIVDRCLFKTEPQFYPIVNSRMEMHDCVYRIVDFILFYLRNLEATEIDSLMEESTVKHTRRYRAVAKEARLKTGVTIPKIEPPAKLIRIFYLITEYKSRISDSNKIDEINKKNSFNSTLGRIFSIDYAVKKSKEQAEIIELNRLKLEKMILDMCNVIIYSGEPTAEEFMQIATRG